MNRLKTDDMEHDWHALAMSERRRASAAEQHAEAMAVTMRGLIAEIDPERRPATGTLKLVADELRAALLTGHATPPTDPTPMEQEISAYRKAINKIDDRIEYTQFTKEDIHTIIDELTLTLDSIWNRIVAEKDAGTCPHGYPQTVRCSRCGE